MEGVPFEFTGPLPINDCSIVGHSFVLQRNRNKRQEVIDQLVQTTKVFEPFVDLKEYIEYPQKVL